MLDLKSGKIEIKFNDKVYNLRKPTVFEVQKMSDVKENESVKAITEMFKTVGLPKAVCDQLEVEHMKLLVKELTVEKK